mgnify:CR=1 FL=1
MAHDPLQIALGGTEQQMIMVTHQTIGMPFGIEPVRGFGQQGQKIVSVCVGLKNSPAGRSPIHHVVPRTGKLDSQWSGHERRVT